MFCRKCGKAVPEDKKFCSNCGAPVEEQPAAEARPEAPVASVSAAAPVMEAGAAAKKPRKWWLWATVGGAGLLVIIAVVLVLVLVVFKGSSGPEGTVQKFFNAAQARDSAAAYSTIQPSFFKGNSDLVKAFKDGVFKQLPKSAKFKGLAYETTIDGDKGTVKLTGGKITFVRSGKEQSAPVSELGDSATFHVVKEGGNWYIEASDFGNVWGAYYKKKGDDAALATDSELEKLKTNLADLESLASATPLPPVQEWKDKISVFSKQVDTLENAYAKLKEDYKKLTDLGPSASEGYAKYADLKTQQMDKLIQWARQTIDLNNYFADNLALVRAGQSINAAAFTNEVTNRSKAVQVLLNEINSLTEQITQLSDSLQ